MYALQIKVNGEVYYLADTQGTISRSLQDAMIFPDELSMAGFDGKVEHIYENAGKDFDLIATAMPVEVKPSKYGWLVTDLNLEHYCNDRGFDERGKS